MGNLLSSWYNEGISCVPPPCMFSTTCYRLLSENPVCLRIGKFGTEWGRKNRSPIMFWAFWISFVSWILLAASIVSISTESSSVRAVPFFKGTITYTNITDQTTADFNFYAGLNRIVVDDCNDRPVCPSSTQSWNSESCRQFFTSCEECEDSSTASVTMVIVSFITQIPQISTDLTRSKVTYDLHCQKLMGILTGILSLLGTLSSINSFADSCYRDIEPSVDNITLDKKPGAALIFLIVATILKLFDIWAHLIVPVPETDYWKPDQFLAETLPSVTRNSNNSPTTTQPV